MPEEDYLSSQFIHFKSAPAGEDDSRVGEGMPCVKCGDSCPGFGYHQWRKWCQSCHCVDGLHVGHISKYPQAKDRMFLQEDDPPEEANDLERANQAGYSWVPRGLSNEQIDQYMSAFPEEKVPKVGSEGERYRLQQLAYQLPLQDFSANHCHDLNNEQHLVMTDWCKRRENDALGVGAVIASISDPVPCYHCGQEIGAGTMAVVAEKAGPEKLWHPACFACKTCTEPLVDLVYFFHEENMYCGRHYGEKLKPRCTGCEDLVFVGKFIVAMEKEWHPEHFRCFRCDDNITENYVTAEEHPCCINCYNAHYAHKCNRCTNPISPGYKDVIVKGQHWHDVCFICSGCQKSLLNESFTFKDDKMMCHECRGISPSKVCAECDDEFVSGQLKVAYKDRTFHEKCFVCSECAQPIGAQQFILRHEKRVCIKCYEEKYAKVCAKCTEKIRSNFVTYDEDTYHTQCFLCSECEGILANNPFFKVEKKCVCQGCYKNQYAKKCLTCEEHIMGGVRYMVYDGKYWHRDCFKCVRCAQRLPERFRMREEGTMCIDCSNE